MLSTLNPEVGDRQFGARFLFLLSECYLTLTRRATPIDWMVRIAAVILPSLLLSTVILQPWVEPKWMFLDPLTAAQLSGDCCHSHYGFVSTLGIMLWVTIAANALFLEIFSLATRRSGAVFWFAVSACFLNGWLALDDAFLLHETVLPAFGVPQNVVVAAYVSLALIYLATNLRALLTRDVWLLIIGGLALVASLAVDTLFHSLDPARRACNWGACPFRVKRPDRQAFGCGRAG